MGNIWQKVKVMVESWFGWISPHREICEGFQLLEASLKYEMEKQRNAFERVSVWLDESEEARKNELEDYLSRSAKARRQEMASRRAMLPKLDLKNCKPVVF